MSLPEMIALRSAGDTLAAGDMNGTPVTGAGFAVARLKTGEAVGPPLLAAEGETG